jgi:CRISPR-associated protein Csd1
MSGCLMVCFNNPSENSYGKEQSYNSGISQKAMLKYTEALNYLLKSPEHHTVIDNMTLVYFVNKKEESDYIEYFNVFALGNDDYLSSPTQKQVEENLHATITEMTLSVKHDFSYYDNLDDNVKYYIFGLVPNASRLAVKFSYVNTFGQLRKNLEKFNNEFAIGNTTKAPKLWMIKEQLKSPVSGGDLPPDITTKLLQCILNGTPFPQIIMQTLVSRIKTDSDTKEKKNIKMNNTRIGLLKACVIRKCKEEIITPMLNTENTDPAYLCGRLFAVLEIIQKDSLESSQKDGDEKIQMYSADDKLNKTIKDTYFSSAMSTPAVIFARLMKLSQYHLAKLDSGKRNYFNGLICSIIANLPSFPTRLDLTEQSIFIIGYYQQNTALYSKQEKKEEN